MEDGVWTKGKYSKNDFIKRIVKHVNIFPKNADVWSKMIVLPSNVCLTVIMYVMYVKHSYYRYVYACIPTYVKLRLALSDRWREEQAVFTSIEDAKRTLNHASRERCRCVCDM